jgi:hypothetical protein
MSQENVAVAPEVKKPVGPTFEEVKQKVTVKRSGNYRIHEVVLGDSEISIGGCLNGMDVLRGCSQLEERMYLPQIIGVEATDVNFAKAAREYWSEFQLIIPVEGAILNCNHLITKEPGKADRIEPENPRDWMTYNFLLKHPFVAASKEEALGNKKIKAYISDSFVETKKEVDALTIKTKMRKKFLSLTEEGAAFKGDILRSIITVLKSEGLFKEAMPADNTQLTLISEKYAEKYPEKWLALSEDKYIVDKAFVQDLIAKNIIRVIGNAIYDDKAGDSEVASDFDAYIKYINDGKNSAYKARLAADLKTVKR